MKVRVEPLSTSIDQIMAGLDKFRLIRQMKEDESGFRLIFCYSEALLWTYDIFLNNLIPSWSEEGSNKKRAELSVYRAFTEMCEICFHDGNYYYLFFSLYILFSSNLGIPLFYPYTDIMNLLSANFLELISLNS